MSFGVRQANSTRTWAEILIEESEASLRAREGKRDRTFRRMYLSVFTTFAAAFLVYCSLFYIGAFVDVGNIVGISQSARVESIKAKALDNTAKKTNAFNAAFTEAFAINRIYVRKNQSIITTYNIPRGAVLTLTVKQCKARPILEVFGCDVIGEQKTQIKSKTTGTIKFTLPKAGFYYFDDAVIKPAKVELVPDEEYTVIWQRG